MDTPNPHQYVKWLPQKPSNVKLAIGWSVFFGAGLFGWWLDRQETLRMTSYRGKSKLYGRPYAEGEPLPWP